MVTKPWSIEKLTQSLNGEAGNCSINSGKSSLKSKNGLSLQQRQYRVLRTVEMEAEKKTPRWVSMQSRTYLHLHHSKTPISFNKIATHFVFLSLD
jgi:hypothetical protein